MKVAEYADYKPSGVEWLDGVPSHWDIKAARYCHSIQLGKMLQPESSSPTDVEITYMKSQHVQWETIRVEDLPTMWASHADIEKYSVVDGDLLVCEGGDVGRAGIVRNPPQETIIQNALHRVRSLHGNSLRFLMFVLEHAASQGWFEIICNRSTIAHFTGEKFGALRLPIPSLEEQQTIARFLDVQTTRIDTLVAKKRQLIAKLKEKRSALIARTVTRGLPPEAAKAAGLEPNPEMKESGVEWLGQIPAHWAAKGVRYIFRNCDSRRIPLSSEERAVLENIYPYYGASGVIDMVADYLFDEPLVLVAEDGANLLSRSTPLAFLASGKYWVNNHAHILKPLSGDIRYWVAVLETFDFSPLITGAAQPKLTADNLGSIHLPVPPASEQTVIADFLSLETAKLDALIDKTNSAIARLTEYRQALITAAVTGKIDVRPSLQPSPARGEGVRMEAL